MAFPSRCLLRVFPVKIKVLGYVSFVNPSLSRIFVLIRERWLTLFTFYEMVKIQISSGNNNRRTNLNRAFAHWVLRATSPFFRCLTIPLHHPLPSDILTKRGL